jgi:hypothetical protein
VQRRFFSIFSPGAFYLFSPLVFITFTLLPSHFAAVQSATLKFLKEITVGFTSLFVMD